ncbi:MAG: DUF5050 domain-containing protein, partial [Eubacteriales bacterium]|nr:DUF5050 domain-containing protein [Eubacteriales bacterium]
VPENAEISETAGPVPGSGGKTDAHAGKDSAPDIREPAVIPERAEEFPGSDASAEIAEKTEGFPGDDTRAEIPEKTEMFPGSDASAEKPERTEMIPGDDASAVIPGKPGIPPAAGSGRPGTGERGGKKKSSALPALAGMLVLMAVAAAVVVLLFHSLSGIIGRLTHEYALRKKAEKIWEITRDRITEKEKKTNIETNAETKTEGISSGNYYNCGHFAFCDGDLYYISSEGLFRCEGADPEYAERIASDGPRYLNCRNGCLYYLTEFTDEIRRYDPEQNRETTLFDAAGAPDFSPTSLYIWENWCYFAHKMHLYRISMETLDSGTAGPEDAELIAEDYNAGNHVFPSICFLDGEIYYNGSLGLRRTSPAGTKKETVSTELNRNGSLITDGISVFSWYGVYDVYRIETGGESEKLPFPDREARICKFNYCDDRLYYVMDDGEEYSLWQTDRDGSEAECLQSIGSSQDIIVSFCVFPGEKYAYCYRMRKGDDALESIIEKYPLQ